MTVTKIALAVICSAMLGTTTQLAHADFDTSASREFANARFEGEVSFSRLKPVRNGRFCTIARRLNRPARQSLTIEGGLQGDTPVLSYGSVNGAKGAGFYNTPDNPNGIGFDLSTGPDLSRLRDGRSVNCGVSSRSTLVTALPDGRASLKFTESLGCTERQSDRSYVCFDRVYRGIGQRIAR